MKTQPVSCKTHGRGEGSVTSFALAREVQAGRLHPSQSTRFLPSNRTRYTNVYNLQLDLAIILQIKQDTHKTRPSDKHSPVQVQTSLGGERMQIAIGTGKLQLLHIEPASLRLRPLP